MNIKYKTKQKQRNQIDFSISMIIYTFKIWHGMSDIFFDISYCDFHFFGKRELEVPSIHHH